MQPAALERSRGLCWYELTINHPLLLLGWMAQLSECLPEGNALRALRLTKRYTQNTHTSCHLDGDIQYNTTPHSTTYGTTIA